MSMNPVIQEVEVKPEKIWLWNTHLAGVQCAIVTEFGEVLYDVVDKLTATMRHHRGIGLAAPQLGVFKRLAVVHMVDEPDLPILVMANPVILDSNGEAKVREGCLSIPGKNTRAFVKRPASIYFTFQDITGEPKTMQADNLMAVAVQHEIDHLDGKFFIDHLKPVMRSVVIRNYQKCHPMMKPEFAEKYLKDGRPG